MQWWDQMTDMWQSDAHDHKHTNLSLNFQGELGDLGPPGPIGDLGPKVSIIINAWLRI